MNPVMFILLQVCIGVGLWIWLENKRVTWYVPPSGPLVDVLADRRKEMFFERMDEIASNALFEEDRVDYMIRQFNRGEI